jgi:L-arabinose transport system substrate-binding protein
MKNMTRIFGFTGVLTLALLTGCGQSGNPTSSTSQSSGGAGKVKIGFIVKQPEESWFQLEWKFAQQAADANKFELVKIGAVDGEKVLAAIDNLAAQQAQGFVICTPDTKLGPAIAAKAKAANLKLLTVDDQFLGADGQPMADVHHLGISARNIGHLVGQALAAEMKVRGWSAADTALCLMTYDELDTARERTEGAMEAITETGFAKDKIYKAAQKTTDVPGAFDAANILLTQHPEVKHWLICGLNDSAAMGAVRAMEGRGFTAENVVSIGIGGSDDCLSEFKKPKPTGFFASVLLSAKRHGQETSEMMFKWITTGVEPPLATYTDGVLITRETYQKILKEQGL